MGNTINLERKPTTRHNRAASPDKRMRSASGTELATVAMLDMEAIVMDVVEAGVNDWLRGVGQQLNPKEKVAWDRLGDLGKAVKALSVIQKDTLIADHLKERCLAAIKDAKRTISAGRIPKARRVDVRTNNVIEYFKDFLSPLRDIGYASDPKLRAGLVAIRTALPPAIGAIHALAA